MRRAVCALALLPALPAFAQDKANHPDKPTADQMANKAAEALKSRVYNPRNPQAMINLNRPEYELVLWSLLCAGVSINEPGMQRLIETCVTQPAGGTYGVSLLAMCLQAIDAPRFQPVIAQCAQFLVDSQCKNGQWGYGEGFSPTGGQPRVFPPEGKKKALKTLRLKKNPVPKGIIAPKEGDNSNSQYAALALRACYEASVYAPDECLRSAVSWWEKTQLKDGSWSYTGEGAGYGSMTFGGVGSLAILKTLLHQNVSQYKPILRGFEWVGKNYSVEENPGAHVLYGGNKDEKPKIYYYYFLYSCERGCDLTGVQKFDDHDWFAEGLRELQKTQEEDGTWREPTREGQVIATCFAILFLKRATKPLVNRGAYVNGNIIVTRDAKAPK
jgi:hypothetical protein